MKAENIIELAPYHFLMKVDISEKTTEGGIVVADTWEGGRNLENHPEGIVVKACKPCLFVDEKDNKIDTDFFKEGDHVLWKRNCERQFWKEDGVGYSIIHVKNIIATLK